MVGTDVEYTKIEVEVKELVEGTWTNCHSSEVGARLWCVVDWETVVGYAMTDGWMVCSGDWAQLDEVARPCGMLAQLEEEETSSVPYKLVGTARMVEWWECDNTTDPTGHLKCTHFTGWSDKCLEGSTSSINRGDSANCTSWGGNHYEKEHHAMADWDAIDVPSDVTWYGAHSKEPDQIMCFRCAILEGEYVPKTASIQGPNCQTWCTREVHGHCAEWSACTCAPNTKSGDSVAGEHCVSMDVECVESEESTCGLHSVLSMDVWQELEVKEVGGWCFDRLQRRSTSEKQKHEESKKKTDHYTDCHHNVDVLETLDVEHDVSTCDSKVTECDYLDRAMLDLLMQKAGGSVKCEVGALAMYYALTSSTEDAPIKEEALVRAEEAKKMYLDVCPLAEEKTDGSSTSSCHQDGWSISVEMCGDGPAGEDAIVNVCATFDAKQETDSLGHAESCGEAHTLSEDPECPNEEQETVGKKFVVNLCNSVVGMSRQSDLVAAWEWGSCTPAPNAQDVHDNGMDSS